MEIVSEILPLPGLAPGEAVAGGIAGGITTGQWSLPHAPAMPLLYRFTSRLLEVRNLATAALDMPEALATLSTAQLQAGIAEELEILMVTPVHLNQTTHFLIILREAVAKAMRLCVFNPFTLLIHPISTPVYHRIRSISVSAPLSAGSGTSTEWEYAVVCFGLSGGRALIGNLTIGPDGSQLTALEKLVIAGHKSNVSCSFCREAPGTNGRSLVFLGLASGNVAVVEYCPYGLNRTRIIGIVPVGKPQLGSAARISAAVVGSGRFVLAVGHSTSAHTKVHSDRKSSLAAVSVHSIAFGGDKISQAHVEITQIGTVFLQLLTYDEYDAKSDPTKHAITNADIVDLAVVDIDNTTQTGGADAPRSIVVAVLASTSIDDTVSSPYSHSGPEPYSRNRLLHTLFNAWAFNEQTLELVTISSQNSTVSDAVLGMQISGSAAQIDIVTGRKVLIGDALSDSLSLIGAGAAVTVGAGAAGAATYAAGAAFANHGIGKPLDISEYIEVEHDFAYSSSVRSALSEQRRRMDGELFIDMLLSMAGATGGDAASTYPPKSFTEMRGFVERIGASDLDDLKQHCIAYYLLLDMSAAVLVSSHDVYVESDIDPTSLSKAAAKYAADKFIPCHFEYLMRGYWLMDHSQTVVGVSYLADPCVIADWAPKVLRTTVAAGYHLDAARFLNSATALMQPRLEELPSEAPVVMDVFLHCDFDKAFSFQRHISSFLELRQALLTQLFVFALSPCARRSTVDRLAMLPFDDTEEAALETYCLLPETAAHARDFLALHYVNRGRYAEAIRLFRAIAKTDDGQHLTAVQKRKRDERLAMAHNLILLLPAAQRWVIEELESINGETATTAGSEGSTHGSGSALALRQGLSSVPLSASKTARQLRPVVSTHGAAQSASHPLLRVLIKQMTVVKPVASDIELAPSSPCEAVGSDLPSAYLQTSDDDDDDDSSMSVSETQPETPKAKRDPASSTTAKSTWSTPMTSFPDRTLRSPASRSSAAFSPRANTANARSVTPLHSASTPRSSVQRVPFSGPPTTPRTDNVLDMFADMTPTVSGNWAAANQNAGNNILAKASAAVESLSPSPSHSLARRTSGGFVSASASAISTSRSPFAKARLMSINSNNSSDNNNNGSSSHRYSPIEEQLRDDGGTIVSTTAAHSMSLGLTDPNSDAKDSSGDVPAKGNRKKRGSKSRTKRPKPVSLYPAADDTVAACDSESITASSKASARNYERSVCQSAEAEAVAPKQSSRVRKRTVE